MSDLNYLDAGFDPDTDFLGADDDFDDDDEDFGADDDAAIAMLEEEDEAFLVGLIPDDQYGAAKRGRSRGVRRVGRKLRAAQRKRAPCRQGRSKRSLPRSLRSHAQGQGPSAGRPDEAAPAVAATQQAEACLSGRRSCDAGSPGRRR